MKVKVFILNIIIITRIFAASVDVSIVQSLEGPSGATQIDLTEQGNLDWALFSADAGLGMLMPANVKSGVATPMSFETFGTVNGETDLFGGEHHYSFTDGMDPVSGTATQFDRLEFGAEGGGIRITASVPTAGSYALRLYVAVTTNHTLEITSTLGSGATDSQVGNRPTNLSRLGFTTYFTTDGADTLTMEVSRSVDPGSIIAIEAASLAATPAPELVRMYHIGNSLTVDSKPEEVANIMRNAGLRVEQGYHIRSGSSLTSTRQNPDDVEATVLDPFGRWPVALADFDWDVVTLQAYPGATGNVEIESAKHFINTLTAGGRNADCKIFLYFAWPKKVDSPDFFTRVMTPYAGGAENTFLSSEFLDFWYDEIVNEYPDMDIRVIPTGIALANLDVELRANPIASFSNTHDLYRDIDHMGFDDGRNVASTTMVSTILGVNPQELVIPGSYRAKSNADLMALMDMVVWDTILADARTMESSPLPEISIALNSVTGMLEITFTDELFRSTNLCKWDPVIGAESPYIIAPDEDPEFFQARR